MLGLFRLAVPELHAYFEDEQVPMTSVAISWMTTLLAREMWLGDVLRLWGEYAGGTSADDRCVFRSRGHVCAALLRMCGSVVDV